MLFRSGIYMLTPSILQPAVLDQSVLLSSMLCELYVIYLLNRGNLNGVFLLFVKGFPYLLLFLRSQYVLANLKGTKV